jgi:hypothetical protein
MTGLPDRNTDTVVVELEPAHGEALVCFFGALPDGDRTFIKEDVADPDVVRGWTSTAPDRQWVALADGEVVGYVAVRRLPGGPTTSARCGWWWHRRAAAPGWAGSSPGTPSRAGSRRG